MVILANSAAMAFIRCLAVDRGQIRSIVGGALNGIVSTGAPFTKTTLSLYPAQSLEVSVTNQLPFSVTSLTCPKLPVNAHWVSGENS